MLGLQISSLKPRFIAFHTVPYCKDDGILVIPTVKHPPPQHGLNEVLSDSCQRRNFSLLSIAGMSGCCQVSVPLGFHDNCPVSVSFIAKNGSDGFLLDIVQTMYASLQE
ncbi:hypothetical protein IFM89_014933 [Coptis chinensis]|uniref:Amidase n=1 Tax=Coptis chinensis TaxID=261450 RepID=A0A835H6E7_9MAGN|nr:hypothetical protein IFM89_014933 [Coptis chinensis]